MDWEKRRQRGFTFIDTGQERWLPPSVRAHYRFVTDDPMVRAVRYAPDFFASHSNYPLAY